MTPDLPGKVRAEAQAGPEGFQNFPLPHLITALVIPPEKVFAQGAFDLRLHFAEGFHAGFVFRAVGRSKMLGAEKVQVIEKLVHSGPPIRTLFRLNLIL